MSCDNVCGMDESTINIIIIVGFIVLAGLCLLFAYWWGRGKAKRMGASDQELRTAFANVRSRLPLIIGIVLVCVALIFGGCWLYLKLNY